MSSQALAVAQAPVPPGPRTSLATLVLWGLLLALLAGSWQRADMRPLALFRDAGNMAEYASGFFPPDFSDWRHYLGELVVTLQIALWGTALAIACSVPMPISSHTSSTTRRFSAPSQMSPQGRSNSVPVSRPLNTPRLLARAKSSPRR